MVLIIPVFPLQCRIYVCCLVCVTHAEIGLLVLIHRVCSLCLIAIYLPDCPTYELLQVLVSGIPLASSQHNLYDIHLLLRIQY